jgi:glycosyltransferase involved in cell wall biosynthesis
LPINALVSVVIPTYNRAGTIERAVESVLSQHYPVIEVIVIDDGSKDDTAYRMSHRYGSDSRVRYIYRQNGGVCTARNQGLREAQGEFVAMLDSDDYWLPGKLDLQVGILKKRPELSLIWSDMDAINESGMVISERYLRKYYGAYRFFPSLRDFFSVEHKLSTGVALYSGDISQAMVMGNFIHTSTVVARADRLAAAGEYDQSVHPSEDQDFYYRVCRTGPVAFVDTVTTHYQVGAADAASGQSRYLEMATSSLEVFNRILSLESSNLRISPVLLKRQESDLYANVGEAAFLRGRMSIARTHLQKRLRGCPSDLRSMAYFAMSLLPFPLQFLRLLRRFLGKHNPSVGDG